MEGHGGRGARRPGGSSRGPCGGAPGRSWGLVRKHGRTWRRRSTKALESSPDLGAEKLQEGPAEEMQDGPAEELQENPAEELQEGPTEEPQEGPESGSTAASFDEEEEQRTAGP